MQHAAPTFTVAATSNSRRFFMPTKNRSAQMLLVGFQKHWLMETVVDAIGAPRKTDKDVAELNFAAPFMPVCFWQLKTPARAYIAAQWPKLSAWLIANSGNPEKLLTVIPQIERLSAKAVHAEKINQEDVKSAAYERIKNRQIHASNAIARDIQKSTQRGAWNVCKP